MKVGPKQCNHVDAPHEEPIRSNPLYENIKKACAICLAIFAAYSALSYFLPGFLIGLAIGSVLELKKNHHVHGFMSSCSQGLVGLLGYELPDPIGPICDVVGIGIHIDHHPLLAGVVGLQAGMYVAHIGKQCLSRKVTVHTSIELHSLTA